MAPRDGWPGATCALQAGVRQAVGTAGPPVRAPEACAPGAVGTRRNGSGGLALSAGLRCPRELREQALEKLRSGSLPPAWVPATAPPARHREGRIQEADRATFHICSRYSMEQLSTTSNASPAGPQAGEDLEDKGGWGVRGWDRLSLPVGARPSAPRKPPPASPPPTPQGHSAPGPGPLRVPEGHWTDLGKSPARWHLGEWASGPGPPLTSCPTWPDNNSTFRRWVCTPPHKLPSPSLLP